MNRANRRLRLDPGRRAYGFAVQSFSVAPC